MEQAEKRRKVNITTPVQKIDEIIKQIDIIKNKTTEITIKAHNIELNEKEIERLEATGKKIKIMTKNGEININKENPYSEKRVRTLQPAPTDVINYEGINIIKDDIQSGTRIVTNGLLMLMKQNNGLIEIEGGSIMLKPNQEIGIIKMKDMDITDIIKQIMQDEQEAEFIYIHMAEDGIAYEII